MKTHPQNLAAALLALAFPLPLPAVVKNFYASPSGITANDGLTPSTPVDLVTAQAKVRSFIQPGMSDDVIVHLLGGNYERTQTLVFNNQDSGNNGFRVIWQAYQNETPVLHGGKAVGAWLSGGGDLYRLNGPGANGAVPGRTIATKFRNFWFNGERRPWAASSAVTGSSWHIDSTTNKPDGINVPSSAIASTTANHGTIELSWRIAWMHHRLPVKQISTAGGISTIYLEQAPLDRALAQPNVDSYWPGFDKPFVLENVWGEMAPGRWYHSVSSGNFFYRLLPGETTVGAVGVYPQLAGPFFRILGSSPTSRVTNLTFRGLTFRYSDLHYANTKGVLNKQAGHWLNPTDEFRIGAPLSPADKEFNYKAPGYQPEGAIQVENASGLVLERNTFEHLGTAGVVFRSAVDASQIVGNVFDDISEGAISLGTWTLENPSAVDNQVKNITVVGNLITEVGVEYNGAPGICAYFVQDTVISHNTLEDLPYSGISLGWGWNRDVATDRRSARNTISNNNVTTYLTTLFDGGGVYVLGRQPDASNGSVITGNYLVDMQSSYQQMGGAIYPDLGSNHWSIGNNVVEDVNYTWLYIWDLSIKNITASGNWSTTSATHNNSNNASNNSIDLPTVFNPDGTIPADALNVIAGSGHATRNLALAGGATSRSTLSPYNAPKANDNNLASLWSSAGVIPGQNKTEWWQIDLQNPHRLVQIEVHARQDTINQPSTRTNLGVWASNDPAFTTYDILGTVDSAGNYVHRGQSHVFAFQGMWPVDVDAGKTYRYVRVTKTKADEYLTLAEVRVIGW